ncbi:hypothetical protein [Roseomonas chloroacetimidivorans]|jgi:hypothetical protein|uniref:hypothetical protein n=1 Tax=Roseomonas chloroacetimidivorans TaxID=1766656 RepID=UPI003C75B70B
MPPDDDERRWTEGIAIALWKAVERVEAEGPALQELWGGLPADHQAFWHARAKEAVSAWQELRGRG